MTDEHEHAMKVWREACGAYEDAAETMNGLTMRGDALGADQAAAAIIAADRAGLVARIERLRKELEAASDFIGNLDHTKAGEKVYRRIRAALKDTRHD